VAIVSWLTAMAPAAKDKPDRDGSDDNNGKCANTDAYIGAS